MAASAQLHSLEDVAPAAETNEMLDLLAGIGGDMPAADQANKRARADRDGPVDIANSHASPMAMEEDADDTTDGPPKVTTPGVQTGNETTADASAKKHVTGGPRDRLTGKSLDLYDMLIDDGNDEQEALRFVLDVSGEMIW